MSALFPQPLECTTPRCQKPAVCFHGRCASCCLALRMQQTPVVERVDTKAEHD